MITKDMKIQEAIQKYPEIFEVLIEYGVACAGCALSELETIEEGAAQHNIDVNEFLDDLNYIVEEYYSNPV